MKVKKIKVLTSKAANALKTEFRDDFWLDRVYTFYHPSFAIRVMTQSECVEGIDFEVFEEEEKE